MVLETSNNEEHWNHPDFKRVEKIIIKNFQSVPIEMFRRDTSLSGIDIISFSCKEIENVKQGSLVESFGPLKYLTFLAFDFLRNYRLIWGEDILMDIEIIENPLVYKNQRIEWIKKRYTIGRNKNDLSRILTSLGSVIEYFVVLDGIRDLKKTNLEQWALQYNWNNDSDTHYILKHYFEFILEKNSFLTCLNEKWKSETIHFLDSILFQNHFYITINKSGSMEPVDNC